MTYDGKTYPGEVIHFDGDMAKVSVMHEAGGHYKWPMETDAIFYANKDIVRKIEALIVVGNRGQFRFASEI